MKAFSFDEIMAMDNISRFQLRKQLEAEGPSMFEPTVERIQKIADHTGLDLLTTASVIFKHDERAHAEFRRQSFRRV